MARIGVVMLASASLAAAPGFVAAQSQSGSGQASTESKPADQSGGTASPKPANETPNRPASPQNAGEVGDRLHDSAKGFGEAILGGIKYAGRKVINFFND